MLLKTVKTNSKRALCLLIAFSLCFSVFCVTAFSATAAEKAAYQEKIDSIKDEIAANKEKIAKLKSEAAGYSDDISSLQKKIDVLQDQVDLYNDEIAVIDKDIGSLNDQITSVQNEIDALNKEINNLDAQVIVIDQKIADTYTLLGQRIRANYMSGNNSSLEYLLTSDNFEFQSYLERLELLSRVSDHDDAIVNQLQDSIDSLNKKLDEIKDMKSQKASKIEELDGMKEDLEAKKQDQVNARSEVQSAQNDILSDLNEVKSKVSALNSQSSSYQAAIDKGEEEINNYESKMAQSDASYGSGTVSGAGMVWPLPYSGTYISSPFGWRTLNGGTSHHNGIDICHPPSTYGATVVAAKEGRVFRASYGYNGGCGNNVAIDHGNGVQTYYFHLSQINVSVGDYVARGAKIGAAGNTGYSFGAHLHFGVLVNGSWVNPLNYVSKP